MEQGAAGAILALHQSQDKFRRDVDASAADAVASVAQTHEKLRGELSGVLDQLGQTGALLRSLASASGDSLTAVETRLGERAREFQTILELSAGHVAALSDTSKNTLGEAHALADKLAAQSHALAGAVSDLAETNANADAALDSRRVMLERLLASVGSKTEDFDSVMQSFAGLVDDGFKQAEARAREVGTFLSDATQATAGAISQQYELVRTTTGKERERTAAALRAAYDQANTEMSHVFGQATEKFQNSMQELRAVTSEIQRELETTREALQRGVADFPRQAAEQTAGMKRIVSDQVKALNELTQIVSRSGQSLDMSAPAAPTRAADIAPAPAARRAPEPLAPAPVRLPAPPPAAVSEPLLRARPPAPRPAAPPAPAARGPGWLSELLARASHDDRAEAKTAAPAPRGNVQSVDSLDSISLEIAEMIDDTTVADLWDRYRAGESNVFSRRLYTAQGQQTFDEIRRRYRVDGDFRATVDRYTQEFERLLAEAGRDDRDSLLARSYLTSDTGKVYTMLAHAAGRFD